MINVLLCDDDLLFLNLLEQRFLSYADCKIYKFSSSQEVYASDLKFDIAFLDIQLDNNTSGFSLVKHIRNNNSKCIISFFTNYRDYAIEGYEYRAFRYILKTEPDKIIKRKIDDVFEEFRRQSKLIKGTYRNQSFAVSPCDIYFIDTFNHVITLHTRVGNFKMYKNIKEIVRELSVFGFFRCHRSYVVNPEYISAIDTNKCIKLREPVGETIPIGINYRCITEEVFMEQRA